MLKVVHNVLDTQIENLWTYYVFFKVRDLYIDTISEIGLNF